MSERIWALDTIRIEVPVTEKDGSPFNLTGATIVAVMARGDTVIGLTPSIVDAVAGEAAVSAPAGSLSVGAWQMQVRVTRGGVTSTVVDTGVTVLKSLPNP